MGLRIVILFVLLTGSFTLQAQNLAGTSWLLISIDNLDNYKSTQVPESIGAVLRFENDSVFTARICNNYRGRFKHDGTSKIAMARPAGTKMYCIGVDKIEAESVAAFTTTYKYRVKDDLLFLLTNDGKRLQFRKQ